MLLDHGQIVGALVKSGRVGDLIIWKICEWKANEHTLVRLLTLICDAKTEYNMCYLSGSVIPETRTKSTRMVCVL